jgi:lactoylglutathione lyase
MDIRLLVLRTGDTKRLAEFYSLFGLKFDYHKHGDSPLHYSTTIGKTVLEIYPLTKRQIKPDKNLRLGFGIDNFDETIQKLKKLEVAFSLEPTQTNFGFMSIISDPDDRKIELYKK